MNNYIYYVTQRKREADGKMFAIAHKVPCNYNLIDYFRQDDIVVLSIFPTWKKAKEVAEYWNKCFKKNEQYID